MTPVLQRVVLQALAARHASHFASFSRLCVGNGAGAECVQVLLLLLPLHGDSFISPNLEQVTERLSQSKIMGGAGGGSMSTPFFASKCKAVSPYHRHEPLLLFSQITPPAGD